MRTNDGKRVDLELRFAKPDATRAEQVRVLVEVKLDAKPHDQQLESYLREIDAGQNGALILLAPAEALPFALGLVPPRVSQRSWESAAALIRAEARVNDDPVQTYLLEELLSFMADAGLTSLEALLPEHLVALAYLNDVRLGVEALTEQVSRLLQLERGTASSQAATRGRPKFGTEYWEAWNREDGAWLDWNIGTNWDHDLSIASDALLVAGIAREKLAPDLPDPRAERETRLTEGVRVDGYSLRFEWATDEVERFAVFATPSDVLRGQTMEEQADSVARWVLASWRALEAPLDDIAPVGST